MKYSRSIRRQNQLHEIGTTIRWNLTTFLELRKKIEETCSVHKRGIINIVVCLRYEHHILQ